MENFFINNFNLFQNGYPSRRRSLVDDARFESAVVKQTKQAVLEEARLKANGECQNFSACFWWGSISFCMFLPFKPMSKL